MSMCLQNPIIECSCQNNSSGNITAARNWMSSQATFPVRLHAMLAEVEMDPVLSRMVAWRPHGRLFVVEDREGFMKHILPNWFTMNSYASFQRQCNMYGFRRMTSGPDKGGYYHELFLRGNPAMAACIPRIKYKGTGPRKPARPEEEPDFYKIPAPICERPSAPSTQPQPCGGECTTPPLSLGALLAGGRYTTPPPQANHPVLVTPVPPLMPLAVTDIPSSSSSSGQQQQQQQQPVPFSAHREEQQEEQPQTNQVTSKSFDDLVDALDYSINAVDDALVAWEQLELEPFPL